MSQSFKDLRLHRWLAGIVAASLDAMLKAVPAVPAYLTLRHTFHETPSHFHSHADGEPAAKRPPETDGESSHPW
jgi:hypothetical protein